MKGSAHVFDQGSLSGDPLSILDQAGRLVAGYEVDGDDLRRLYESMVWIRTYDRKATAMQLQGRLATYSPFFGQEACQIGSVAALADGDWLAGTYRDAGAMWFRGYSWERLFLGRTGDERGGQPAEDVTVMPPSITVGGHMVHAVGLSWAEKMKGSGKIALTMFGEGATSEGDFHEAMNFAGVFHTPTVFFCQNNQYAISAPREIQTASDSIAQKALAYGMVGYLVNGNDVLAVREVTAAAAERARNGDGPSLIEAITYRRGPHTTADDPTKYRTSQEEDLWTERDPLERVRAYLADAGLWDEPWQTELEEAAGVAVETAVGAAEALPKLDAGNFFDAVFENPNPTLSDEKAAAARRLELGEA